MNGAGVVTGKRGQRASLSFAQKEVMIDFSPDNQFDLNVWNDHHDDDDLLDDEKTFNTTTTSSITVLTAEESQEPITAGNLPVRATNTLLIQPLCRQRRPQKGDSSHSASSSNSNNSHHTLMTNDALSQQQLKRSGSVQSKCNNSRRLGRRGSAQSVCSASSEEQITTDAPPQQHPRPRRKGSARGASSDSNEQQQQPIRIGSVSPSKRRGRVLRRSLSGDAQLKPKQRLIRSKSCSNDDTRATTVRSGRRQKSCDLDTHFLSSEKQIVSLSKQLKGIGGSNNPVWSSSASLIDYYSSDDDNSCMTTSTCESRKDHYATMLKSKKKKRGKAAIEEIKTSLSMAASVTPSVVEPPITADIYDAEQQPPTQISLVHELTTRSSASSLQKHLSLQRQSDNNSNHGNSFSVDSNSKGKARLLQKLRNELVSHPSSKQGPEIVGNVETATKTFIQPKSITSTAPLITSEKASSIPTTTTTRVQCPQEQREHQENNNNNNNKPRRITKLEKIEQLQNENLKCREEFKVVYQERNELRKSVEHKQKQIVDLQKDVEEYGIQNYTLVESMQKVTNELLEVKEKQKEMPFALETECKSGNTMKEDLMKALKLINSHKAEIINLQDIISRKDDQITNLLNESANQALQIQKSQEQLLANVSSNNEDSYSLDGFTDKRESDVSECPSASAMRSGYGKMTQIIREGEDKIRILEEENERLKLEKDNEILLKEKSNQMLLKEIEKLKNENYGLRNDLQETRDNVETQKEHTIDDMGGKYQADQEKELQKAKELIKKKEYTIQQLENEIIQYSNNANVLLHPNELDDEVQKKSVSEMLKLQEEQILTLKRDNEVAGEHIIQLKIDIERSKLVIKERNNEYEDLLREIEHYKHNNEVETGHEIQKLSDMVAAREDAIAELLKECDELRGQLDEADRRQLQEGSKYNMIQHIGDNGKKQSGSENCLLENELEQQKNQERALLEEVAALSRQNDILSEEVEEWIARGSDMDMLIAELRGEIETLKEAAALAQSSSEVKMASLPKNEVSRQQIENEVRSTNQLDVGGIVRGFGSLLLSEKKDNCISNNYAKRIEELEDIKGSQEKLIENLKIDIKKLGIAFRIEMNKSKSSMINLANENEECQRKLKEIEGKNIKLQELLCKRQQENMTAAEHISSMDMPFMSTVKAVETSENWSHGQDGNAIKSFKKLQRYAASA